MYSLPKLQRFDILLAFSLVVASIILYQFQLFKQSDNIFYDLQSEKIENLIDDSIVIVTIDDASIKKLGRWPWSRAIHAKMLDHLSAAGVKAIGLDVLFMDPDTLHQKDDLLLINTIIKNDNIVLPVLTRFKNNSLSIAKSASKITDAAYQGHVNLHYDEKGVVRKLNIRIKLTNGQVLPSLALALSQQLNKNIDFSNVVNDEPTLISFANPSNQFQQYSYSDVLLDPTIHHRLKGKTILIGMTATGLSTRIATPVSKNQHLISGIEFQANALSAIQSGQIIKSIDWPVYALISFFLIFLPVITYPFIKPGNALLLTLGFMGLTLIGSYLLLSGLKIWAAPSSILFCLILSYPLWTLRKIKQLDNSLFKQHAYASATLKAIDDAVITTNREGYVKFMNPAAEKMFACKLEEARKKRFSDLYQVVEKNESKYLATHFLTDEEHQGDAKIIRNTDNNEFAVHLTSSPIYSESGQQTGIVYALNDLTEIININKKITFLATHDTLTGLANRTLIQDLIEQAINSASRENINVAILFIDLDGFKKINDAMGHDSGDLLLQEVAKRLQNCIRQSDTTARWGGDEFIVLLDQLTHASDASEVASKIKNSLGLAFTLNNQEVFITPSIGISLFPVDGHHVNILLARADTAMYNVKLQGKNNFCFYSQSLETQAKEKLTLDRELRHAIQHSEFKIYYQPQFDLDSNHLIGLEALIRWQHPEKGLLLPGKFIPHAEETGLIIPIGDWLIKNLCHQLKVWQQHFPIIQVAINLSARQFLQDNLVNNITNEIKAHGIKPKSLQIEVTESMMIHDIDQVIKTLNDFKDADISIAIDDFGTGYSSLEYLKRLPIDKLKIDQSFIRNVLYDTDDASIVQAVIAMGHNMNMEIIAEGVENKAQAEFLKAQKCDYAQGYFYSKPVSAFEMEIKIEEYAHKILA